MRFKFIKTSDPEYPASKMLRWEILRKPLGMPPGSEVLPEESNSLHLVVLEKKFLVGCVLFHPEDKETGRLFHLALTDSYQDKGLARKLLQALEEFLILSGYKNIYCYARQESESFYQRMGFASEGDLVTHNGVVHRLMRKALTELKKTLAS